MKIFTGILFLFLATIISFVIANLPTGKDEGLAGLFLLIWPPILGAIGIIIFAICSAITKNQVIRMIVLITWSIYLIYVGIGLYIDRNWPLIYW